MGINASDMDATVGIITRTKDRPVLLKRALESIVNQSYEDWYLVIVNDGGDPAVVDQLVDHYASQLRERISVIHNPSSLGMEAASNKGIRSIRTRYLVIHDDDDSWAPEFLTISVAEIEQISRELPNIAGVVTLANTVYERVEGSVVYIDRTVPYRTSEKRGLVSLDELLTENQFAPIQFLFRYDAAQAIDFFRADLPVLGDWDFNIRFMSRCDVYIIPQFLAFYHHRITDQSIYGNSIFAGKSRHEFYATMLKNEWLRKDFTENRIGMGAHIALRQAIHHMEKAINALPAHSQRELAGQNYSLRLRRMGELVSMWMTSGQKLRTVSKFFRILFSEGIGSAIRQIKLWYLIRNGR
ncbi:MAG: glycosyltransferase family 2 protein [Burkholderiales bacterium]|nr:glycosyltransferase family 2 protein [Nitrosomonas sp.]MCP5275949.1 glycosyltransferase family 2 protein [Burkholderiales bacterium]